MGKLKELPKIDRPREKALRYGINTLSDTELLALLLNSGYKDKNIIELSSSILTKYGGIVGLLTVPIMELKKNKGIKDVGALKISLIGEFYRRIYEKKIDSENAIINDEYLYNKYRLSLETSNQEQLILIILNRKKQIVFETILYKGLVNSISYDFNDIYKQLAKFEGKYFYLIHNHPSGDCSPSEDDINATIKIMSESRRMRFFLLDHIIIGDGAYYSFKKMKKITIYC